MLNFIQACYVGMLFSVNFAMDVTVQTVQDLLARLSPEDLKTASKFIQFLLENRMEESRKPIDFSKYDTATHIWNEDAQEFVDGMRRNDRF